MHRILLILAALLGFENSVHSTQWTDPGFEEMVAGAELIAVVEVLEGGKFICSAKVIEVLKGADPGGQFHLGYFNNEAWPAEGIKKESMAKGDRLLAFLQQLPWLGEGDEEEEGKQKDAAEKKKPPEMVWAVPTPSTGDFRIIDGKLHGGWYILSYPHSQPGIDAEAALTLVRGYLLHLSGKPPAEARKLLREKLTADLSKGVNEEDEGKENSGKAKLLEWLLCAQGAYGEKEMAPAVLAAAKANHDLLKICAARALRSCGQSVDVQAALGELLRAENSFAQAEAAKAILLNDTPREKAIPMFLKALPDSSIEDGGPTRIMDPILNTSASGRESIIRALTHFSTGKEAHDELLKLIQDEGLTQGVFIALAEHFLKFPSEKARAKFIELYNRCPNEALPLFHGYLIQEKSAPALKAVAERVTSGNLERMYCERALQGLLEVISRKDPLLEKVVHSLLKRFESSEDAQSLLAYAIPAASIEIDKLLAAYSESGLDEDGLKLLKLVREAVRLKIDSTGDARKKLDRWLELIERSDEVPDNGYLLEELTRSTPDDLREYVVKRIREINSDILGSEELKAVKALGGKLSDQDERLLKALAPSSMFEWFR